MEERTYTSPLRERQAQQTRDMILDSLTDLLETSRTDEVTTRALAEAAGVSQRTVYRHFPDRDALLAGLTDRLTASDGGARPVPPESIDDVPAMAIELMAGLDEHHVLARAEALFNADPRRFSPATRENSEGFTEMITGSFPELGAREQVQLAAVFRCLLSAQAWLRMREEFGVPGVESGPVVAWVLETLISQIRLGNGPGAART
jgi:AcrR family transcriptional regulator